MDEDPAPNYLDPLARALSALLPAGLPAGIDAVDQRLLELRGVIARSTQPDDKLSRIDALNRLLVQQITKIPFYKQRDLAAAAVVLFALNKASRRLDLTRRYESAAKVASYSADHFRKKIVSLILLQLAAQLHQDGLNYSGAMSPATEISGDLPSLTLRHFASKEVALHEEHISRTWEHVYGLRAALLAVQRLKRWPDDENGILKLEEARASTLWYLARLGVDIKTYVKIYGKIIPKGDAEFSVESLIRFAGWTGELPPELFTRVRLLAASEPTKEGFLTAVKEAKMAIESVGE